MLYRHAVSQGLADVEALAAALVARMSPREIADADALAGRWTPGQALPVIKPVAEKSPKR